MKRPHRFVDDTSAICGAAHVGDTARRKENFLDRCRGHCKRSVSMSELGASWVEGKGAIPECAKVWRADWGGMDGLYGRVAKMEDDSADA